VVLNKDSLISIFEHMFGSGGYIGSAINNIEHQIKHKKYSLAAAAGGPPLGGGVGADNSMSYFSNATTKDY
jgi:hypothetical protein